MRVDLAEAEASSERATRELAHVVRYVDAHLVDERRRPDGETDLARELVELLRTETFL